jgi:uncharacterized protein YraI
MVFGYNRLVVRIKISLLFALVIMSSGCDSTLADQTATPDFVTAVLPPTPAPIPTSTVIPSASTLSAIAGPTMIPIEGTTTTQVNVRAEPSTASESVGMIGIFTKIQVTGKDASGSWYQIVYAGSEKGNGWVRAEYVQVDATAEIAVIGAMAGSGSAVSGLVIEKINVRNGPGTTYESLGVLSPNDVVFITGKDPSGAWMKIEFANAPEGTGWVASEFLQVSNTDSLPTIGETQQAEEGSTSIPSAPTAIFLPAMEDGDSMQTPLAVALFSSTNSRALQIMGDVSAPDGDTKDWIQFSAVDKVVVIGITCSTIALQVELWRDEVLASTFQLPCGDKQSLTITPNNWYFISLSEPNTNETQYTNYTLTLEILH